GSHSVQAEFYGPGARTSDNLISLEVLTYRGVRLRVGATTEAELDAITRGSGPAAEIYRRLRELRDRNANLIRERYPKIPRRVSGYNLDELLPEKGFNVARALAGTEGTCVAYLEAELALIPDPPERVLLVLGFPDVAAAGAHVPLVREHRPLAIEGLDDRLVADLRVEGFERQVAELLPPVAGSSSSSSAETPWPTRVTTPCASWMSYAAPAAPLPCCSTTAAPRRTSCGSCARRGSARPRSCPDWNPPGPAGRTRRSLRTAW